MFAVKEYFLGDLSQQQINLPAGAHVVGLNSAPGGIGVTLFIAVNEATAVHENREFRTVNSFELIPQDEFYDLRYIGTYHQIGTGNQHVFIKVHE